MLHSFFFKNRGASVRRPLIGECIYCGATEYRFKSNRTLGEEHVIPESLGGTLILPDASCEQCEKTINEFEQRILKTVLYAPRVFLGVRRKRRKRKGEHFKFRGTIDGNEVEIDLPIREIPVLLFLLEFGPPSVLANRPHGRAEMRGAWVRNLTPIHEPFLKGFTFYASPVLDTFRFSQFLAKIAHGFAIDRLGVEGFDPLLLDVILTKEGGQRYDLIGGKPTPEPPSENLHELAINRQLIDNKHYIVVSIRLFASLGAPTYLVVAGTERGERG